MPDAGFGVHGTDSDVSDSLVTVPMVGAVGGWMICGNTIDDDTAADPMTDAVTDADTATVLLPPASWVAVTVHV